MQVSVQSFSDLKTNEFGTSAKVQLSNGEQVYINEDPAKLVGKTVDIEVTEKNSKAGRKYKIGKIAKVYEATATTSNGDGDGNGNGNGKITWDDYRKVAEAAHELAAKLEPDETTLEREDTENGITNKFITKFDRSPARVGFVNNVMRAYAEGRFIVPKEEDETPPF